LTPKARPARRSRLGRVGFLGGAFFYVSRLLEKRQNKSRRYSSLQFYVQGKTSLKALYIRKVDFRLQHESIGR